MRRSRSPRAPRRSAEHLLGARERDAADEVRAERQVGGPRRRGLDARRGHGLGGRVIGPERAYVCRVAPVPRSQHGRGDRATLSPPGRLAQLGEHQLDKLGVTGSSPVPPMERPAGDGGFFLGGRTARRGVQLPRLGHAHPTDRYDDGIVHRNRALAGVFVLGTFAAAAAGTTLSVVRPGTFAGIGLLVAAGISAVAGWLALGAPVSRRASSLAAEPSGRVSGRASGSATRVAPCGRKTGPAPSYVAPSASI